VRLLALGTGDPNGEAVTADSMDPHAGELEQAALEGQSNAAHVLRSQTVVYAILDFLARHGPEFERRESVYLQLEALKALRLVISQPGLLHVGAPHLESLCWTEEEIGYQRNRDMPRLVVEALLHQLQVVGDTMGQRPKILVLGSLWTLATTSNYVRTRILQSGGEAMVANLLRMQVRQPPPIIEAALVIECGILAALAAGSRVHERQLAKLKVEQDALDMLRRFKNHRLVVCAGLVLLALLANDDTVASRITASTQAIEAIAAARARWPEDAERAFKSNAHYVSPAATALLKGTMPPSATQRTETPRSARRILSSRERPMRAAALCVVGGARG
jgi:hypothetical protein